MTDNQDFESIIAPWREAEGNLADADTLARLREEAEQAEAMYEEQVRGYRVALVRRALVYGWQPTSDETGVSAKALHNWHKRYIPDEPDLSRVKAKAVAKEERRILRMEAKAQEAKAKADALSASIPDLSQRLDYVRSLKGGN